MYAGSAQSVEKQKKTNHSAVWWTSNQIQSNLMSDWSRTYQVHVNINTDKTATLGRIWSDTYEYWHEPNCSNWTSGRNLVWCPLDRLDCKTNWVREMGRGKERKIENKMGLHFVGRRKKIFFVGLRWNKFEDYACDLK